MSKAKYHYGDHDFFINNTDEIVIIKLEAGEEIKVTNTKGRRSEVGYYTGENNGDEVDIHPHHSVEVLKYP